MSNAKKVLIIYILFGTAIALTVTASGAYNALVTEGALGTMTSGTYMGIMGVLTIGWLPALVTILMSTENYLRFSVGKLIPAAILLAFMLCCRFFTKRK